MEFVKDFFKSASNFIWGKPDFFPFMVMLLLITGFIVTIRTRLIQFSQFIHAWKVMFGLYDNPEDPGDISHFQAISAALSATVGIGNIAGVATAIHYGGPGALFWMWVTAILGMSLKFAEATLSMKFRKINPDGSASGGPMYYIEKGLGSKFRWMAMLFAFMCIASSFGTGNTIQAFTVADQFRADLNIPTWVTGLITATIVGLVIIGGIKRIGRVASFLMPGMCSIYILTGLIILIIHIDKLPHAFYEIFSSAFTSRAEVGGFVGSTFLFMMMWGVKRGLFSNEAGQGSAPIAHAAAKTKEPVREGIVAMLGPFIDTILVCSITGLVIITTGLWHEKKYEIITANAQADIMIVSGSSEIVKNGNIKGIILIDTTFHVENGSPIENIKFIRNHSFIDSVKIIVNKEIYSGRIYIDKLGLMNPVDSHGSVSIAGYMMQNGSPLTSWSFQKGLEKLGNWGNYIVTIAVFLFAISTAISWSYYGDRATEYLFGNRATIYYKWVYVILHFVGAIVSLEVVWYFGDIAMGLMALPNLITLILLSGTVRRLTVDYRSRTHLTYKEKMGITRGK